MKTLDEVTLLSEYSMSEILMRVEDDNAMAGSEIAKLVFKRKVYGRPSRSVSKAGGKRAIKPAARVSA
jgi:hypothetical protein